MCVAQDFTQCGCFKNFCWVVSSVIHIITVLSDLFTTLFTFLEVEGEFCVILKNVFCQTSSVLAAQKRIMQILYGYSFKINNRKAIYLNLNLQWGGEIIILKLIVLACVWCVWMCEHVCVCVKVCECVYMYVCVNACVDVCVYTCTGIHVHKCMENSSRQWAVCFPCVEFFGSLNHSMALLLSSFWGTEMATQAPEHLAGAARGSTSCRAAYTELRETQKLAERLLHPRWMRKYQHQSG